MAKQLSFSIEESLKALQKNLTGISTAVEEQVNQAVRDLAYATYASIMSKAQSKLKSTREKYLEGLHFEDLGGNNFLISLSGDFVNKLEEGYSAFDMTPGMLKSQKIVDQGQRAGEPWVRTAKDGHRFASVPIGQSPGAAARTSNLADAIKEITAVNARGRKQKITSIFKDSQGNPMTGKVAIGRSDNPKLDGLVKYQSQYTTKSGKTKTRSTYITYRTVSENGKPWIHPGYQGLKAFEDAERDIVKQIDLIIKTLL